jgi:peptidyl-prolyl cis-trans isomerase D
MLRVMRKYQKGVLGILAILFICLAMAGFGIDMFMSGKERQAITVNNNTVSYAEFYRNLRETRERYVQMFGAQFAQLAKSFNLNLPQQVVDQQINGLLIEEQANKLGLTVGEEELKGFLKKSFEGDRARYANFLRSSGYSAAQFEERIKKDLLREQYASLLKLASFASEKEARALLTKEETMIDVQYLQVSSEAVADRAPLADETTLKTYFENNATDFQTKPEVSYEYLAFTPAQFSKDVVIAEEDIAFYLSENEARFSTPARAKIRHIQLLFPKDSTDAQQAEIKVKAEALLKRVRDGESFESIAFEASDDITSKTLGGELGWIDSASADKDVAAKVFVLKQPGIADLVSTSSGYRIIKVDELEASKVKPLAEVKGEIESILRAQEAPSYVASKTLELFEELNSGKTSLADIGLRFDIAAAKTAGLLSDEKDPSTDLKNLTAMILENGDTKKQRVEIGDKVVLVSILEYKEPTVPAFDVVREQISALLKKKESDALAEKVAQEILEKLQKGADFKAIATEYKLTVETKDKLSKKTALTAPFTSESIKDDLFANPQPGKLLPRTYQGDKGFLLIRTEKVSAPTAEDLQKKIDQYREQATTAVSEALTTSQLNELKAAGKIDFDQSILGS